MDLVQLRKLATGLEEIHHEGGPAVSPPRRRAWAAAVIRNPFAGRHVAEIQGLMEALKPLGLEMSRRLVALIGDAKAVDAYGKGAIVGTAGESEHGALWHVPGGYSMRELLGGAKAIVPAAMKVGAFGAALDVPLGHVNAAYVRSHFDVVTVSVADAPRPDEIVYVLAMASGGRVHARVGGLKASEIKGEDGNR
jgi:hypothetical protein